MFRYRTFDAWGDIREKQYNIEVPVKSLAAYKSAPGWGEYVDRLKGYYQ